MKDIILSLSNRCTEEFGIYEFRTIVKAPEFLGYTTKKTVELDACILIEILGLWSLGIKTYGSCCGHGKLPSMVNVSEEDVGLMLQLGYEYFEDPIKAEEKGFCPHTFKLNSQHKNRLSIS